MPSPINIGRNLIPGVVSGGAFGAGIGALSGLTQSAEQPGDRLRNMASSAVSGGLTGGIFGGALGGAGVLDAKVPKTVPRGQRGPTTVDPTSVSWMKGVKTKADAKKAYRAHARANHPDLGSPAERAVREKAMTDANVAWQGVQEHPTFQKWAFDQGIYAACARFRITPVREKTADEGDTGAAVAATAAGASPFLGLIGQKELLHDPYLNKSIARMSPKELAALAREGDVLMMSAPGFNRWKTPQSMSSGTGMYHVEPVVGTRGGRGVVINPGREMTGVSGSNTIRSSDLRDIAERMRGNTEDAVLLRPKGTDVGQRAAIADEAFTQARGSYNRPHALKSFLKDLFIPKSSGREAAGVGAAMEGTICSTPSACAAEKVLGKSVVPGKAAIDALPHDYMRSPQYEAVGSTLSKGYRASRLTPILARAGLGAALAAGAYGAVKGVQKLRE